MYAQKFLSPLILIVLLSGISACGEVAFDGKSTLSLDVYVDDETQQIEASAYYGRSRCKKTFYIPDYTTTCHNDPSTEKFYINRVDIDSSFEKKSIDWAQELDFSYHAETGTIFENKINVEALKHGLHFYTTLEPYDIWNDNFKLHVKIDEAEFQKIKRAIPDGIKINSQFLSIEIYNYEDSSKSSYDLPTTQSEDLGASIEAEFLLSEFRNYKQLPANGRYRVCYRFQGELSESEFYQNYSISVCSKYQTYEFRTTQNHNAAHAIFASNALMQGNFGGIERADEICQQESLVLHSHQNFEWRAVLSAHSESAALRLNGYERLNILTLSGESFAKFNQGLFSTSRGNVAVQTPSGLKVEETEFWTGSTWNGDAGLSPTGVALDCEGWTSNTYGVFGKTGLSSKLSPYNYRTEGSARCNEKRRLLCVGFVRK